MSVISKCFKYKLLQHATDQEQEFRQLKISEPFRPKIIFDDEIAFHLPGEHKDIASEFVGAKAAWSECSQLQRTVQFLLHFMQKKFF